jgi:hypothetical protein
VGSIVASGFIAMSVISVASAATPTSTSTGSTIGTSGISRTTFRQERLDAVAQVLNTSMTNVQTAHKDKTMKQLISSAGLTKTTFREKVKAQLTTDLEGQGYSQDQITIALQQRTIHRMRHHDKHPS